MKLNLTSVLIFVALVVYSITAYYSVGFYHADEHFQIIEFAGLKSGWNHWGDMPWEYFAQIRPTIQPTLAYGLIRFFKFIGITDPYTITFLLRELTGLLIILALTYFFKQTKRFVHSSKKPSFNSLLETLYLGFLLLIWYVPYLGVRFSSETWSAIFLIFAMGSFFAEKQSAKTIILTGLFFGISFLFRYQILFALVGFGIWFLLFNRRNWKNPVLIIGTFLVVFAVGILIDSWFYGEVTISVWNYFNHNILLDKASEFGRYPWDYYLNKLFHLPTKLIGTLFFLSIAASLVFRNKLPFIWMILCFILFHSFVGHKEERFLFPIVFFFPFLFIQFFQLLLEYLPKRIALGLVGLTSLAILFTSIIGISVLAVSPGGLGRNGVTHFIHTQFNNRRVHLITVPLSNPYEPWMAPEKFYSEKNLITTYIGNSDNFNPKLIKKNRVNLFVLRDPKRIHYYLDRGNLTVKYRLIYQSISPYRDKLDNYTRSMDDHDFFYLYELK